jgi:hypothetical protein
MHLLITRALIAAASLFLFVQIGASQTKQKPTGQSATSAADQQAVLSSPAFAEVLLRKTELQADLESLLTEYTEDYPKVKESRYELSMLQKESDRLMGVKETSKLTLALGKLIVRKCELETELWSLLNQYKEGHPDVKRAQKKVDIFEQAIRQILG